MSREFSSKPSSEYRFYLYDPEGEGMIYFKSAEKRDAFAESLLADYKDTESGWWEEIEYASRGEVTEFPQVLDKKPRPPEHELDEDQCDSDGVYWPDELEWRGNYTWEPANGKVVNLTSPQIYC